jgi:cation diffusion facilitator CzcD-associated flavoprotein CzcO
MRMTIPSHGRRKLRFIVIGAGMAGILAAVRLKQDGNEDFTVYEKGQSVGGTWRENRYPGLTCDVPAHAYTYSFAPNAEWSRFFAPGPEIHRYFQQVVGEQGIDEHIRFGNEVVRCEWIDGRWHLKTATGLTDEADVVIAATGVLHHPNIPDIPGLGDFAGVALHSARWDGDLTLEGKRVAIIGTGSTGVQMVSALSRNAEWVIHLQRSPQWIMPVSDFAYSDEDRAAFRADVGAIDAIRDGDEYWAGIRRFNKAIIEPESDAMGEIEEIVRRNLEESVRDPILREKLRPDYRAACKRLIYSPDYYEAVQRPNVAVDTGPIERITAGGVRMKDGTFHEVDVIALATGFRADRFVRPMILRGRDGVDIDQAWRVRPSAYYAVSIPHFPNFFMLNGPTSPVGNFSLIDIAEKQWAYIEQLIDLLRSGEASEMSALPEALADYDERRMIAARTTVFGSGCSSWYLDSQGIPLTWPWSYDSFAEAMRRPRLEDFDIVRGGSERADDESATSGASPV